MLNLLCPQLLVAQAVEHGLTRPCLNPRESSSSWGWLVKTPSGSAEISVGADTGRAGGGSKRKKMKGSGREESSEGLFPLSLHSLSVLSVLQWQLINLLWWKKSCSIIRLVEGMGRKSRRKQKRLVDFLSHHLSISHHGTLLNNLLVDFLFFQKLFRLSTFH